MTLRSRAVDTVFGVLELAAALYDWVHKLRRTKPIPLTRRKKR